MAYLYKGSSLHPATICFYLNKKEMTVIELAAVLNVSSTEVPLSSRLNYCKKLQWIWNDSNGKITRWYITEEGYVFLTANKKHIQKGKIKLIPRSEKSTHRKAYKKQDVEPVFSPAASTVMDEIAPIIDANQALYNTIVQLQLLLMDEKLSEIIPIPKKESGLMASISAIQIDNAKITNALVKIRTQLDVLMEKHNEPSQTGNTQSS